MTFKKQIEIIEERKKAEFDNKKNGSSDKIFEALIINLLWKIVNTEKIANPDIKEILKKIYTTKIISVSARGYFDYLYNLFRTKFNVNINSFSGQKVSTAGEYDFDASSLNNKMTVDYIESSILSKMEKELVRINDSMSWQHFHNAAFSHIPYTSNKNKFYITLDLWDIKNKIITIDQNKIKKFNLLLQYLTDNVTNNFQSKDFEQGKKFIFSMKFNKKIKDMIDDIDNIVLHYNIFPSHPESKKIINLFSDLKNNSNFKEIIVDRTTNTSSFILIDGKEYQIKRASFGKDMTLHDNEKDDKINHQSDSGVKTRIIDYWLRYILSNLYDNSKKEYNIINLFLHPNEKGNDLFAAMNHKFNKTKINEKYIVDKLENVKKNFLKILINNIYINSKIQQKIEQIKKLDNEKLNKTELEKRLMSIYYNLIGNNEEFRNLIFPEIITIINLATDVLNAYNDIIS